MNNKKKKYREKSCLTEITSNEILETDWEKLFYGQDADFCCSLFEDNFLQLCEKHVPESKKLNST